MDKIDFQKHYKGNTANGNCGGSDVNAQYWGILFDMINEAVEDFDINERKRAVELLTEDYYCRTGQTMPSRMLSCLADFLLMETIKDKNVDKVTKNEYPFLSYKQLIRRYQREFVNSIEYIDYKMVQKAHNFAKKRQTQERPDNSMNYKYKP